MNKTFAVQNKGREKFSAFPFEAIDEILLEKLDAADLDKEEQ